RLSRLVTRVSSRTSWSSASTSVSSGSSGTVSSASSLMRSLGRLVDLGDAGRHREQVERIVGKPVAADLEVDVVGRGAAGIADERDQVAGVYAIAGFDQIHIVVGVDGHEPLLVLDLNHELVARLDSVGDNKPRRDRLH